MLQVFKGSFVTKRIGIYYPVYCHFISLNKFKYIFTSAGIGFIPFIVADI